MNDPIETADKALPTGLFYGRTTSTVILSFAIYGAASATHDVVKTVKKVRENRKAKKADETVVETAIPQQ